MIFRYPHQSATITDRQLLSFFAFTDVNKARKKKLTRLSRKLLINQHSKRKMMSIQPTTEQLALLKKLASGQDHLTGENLLYCAWAAALNSQSTFVVEQISTLVAKPNAEQKRAISLAISRMGVTNPYFISRQFVNVMAGGTLNDLGFSPLSAVDETEHAIDAAMRLAAICSSLAKSQFALNADI